jgi:hypothetical protein
VVLHVARLTQAGENGRDVTAKARRWQESARGSPSSVGTRPG